MTPLRPRLHSLSTSAERALWLASTTRYSGCMATAAEIRSAVCSPGCSLIQDVALAGAAIESESKTTRATRSTDHKMARIKLSHAARSPATRMFCRLVTQASRTCLISGETTRSEEHTSELQS